MAKAKRFGHKAKPNPKRKEGKLTARKSRNNNLAKQRTDTEVDEGTKLEESVKDPAAKPARGRGDAGLILTDPNRQRSDLKLVEQSIKKGWNVRRKTMIRRRLENIIMKKEGDMSTKDGVIKSETVADKLAIDASKVLAAMDAADVNRVEKSKESQPPQAQVVNVNVQVDNRRIELARLAQRLGARELLVDGRPIPVRELTGTAVPTPTEKRSQ